MLITERPSAADDLDEDGFWQLIARFDWKKTGNDNAVMEPAIAALSQLSAAASGNFLDILSEKPWRLDTENHARPFTEHHPQNRLSVDDFLYVRCSVVANGRDVYTDILQHPEKMPDLTFSGLLNLAHMAHKRKTGKDLKHLPTYNYETYSNENGWI